MTDERTRAKIRELFPTLSYGLPLAMIDSTNSITRTPSQRPDTTDYMHLRPPIQKIIDYP